MLINMIKYQIKSRTRAVRFRLTKRLPLRDAAGVWPDGDLRVVLRPFAGRFGNLKQHEMITLCAIARHTRRRVSGASKQTATRASQPRRVPAANERTQPHAASPVGPHGGRSIDRASAWSMRSRPPQPDPR